MYTSEKSIITAYAWPKITIVIDFHHAVAVRVRSEGKVKRVKPDFSPESKVNGF